MDVAGLNGCGRGIRLVLEWGRAGSGLAVIRHGHLTAVVMAFLVGCAGCVWEPRRRSSAAAPKPPRSKHARPKQRRRKKTGVEVRGPFDVLKKQGIYAVADSSVQPGDPEARFITNDLASCTNGGLLSGTDKPDRLAGEEGEDEVCDLGAADTLTGGHGRDVIYGGPGDDGQRRDRLYCSNGMDEYDAGRNDCVDSSCEVKYRPQGRS